MRIRTMTMAIHFELGVSAGTTGLSGVLTAGVSTLVGSGALVSPGLADSCEFDSAAASGVLTGSGVDGPLLTAPDTGGVCGGRRSGTASAEVGGIVVETGSGTASVFWPARMVGPDGCLGRGARASPAGSMATGFFDGDWITVLAPRPDDGAMVPRPLVPAVAWAWAWAVGVTATGCRT